LSGKNKAFETKIKFFFMRNMYIGEEEQQEDREKTSLLENNHTGNTEIK